MITANETIPDNWTKTKLLCPLCKNPLFSLKDATGVTVWCAQDRPFPCNSNEAPFGHGNSEAKACEVLMARLGLGKLELEASEEETVSNSTDKPADAPKKRGRKSKGEEVAFTTPKGEFTIKEFCELNNTYPVKALAFIKKMKIRETGKRPTASGRGKPATLYTA